MSVKIDGIEEVLINLDKVIDEKQLRTAIGKACAIVERSAKQNAPKGSGELRRSITSKIEKEGNDIVGIVYTPLEYAPYVEFGTGLFAEEGNGRKDVPWHYKDDKGEWHTTSGMHPHPFMRPALNDNREQITKIVKEAILND